MEQCGYTPIDLCETSGLNEQQYNELNNLLNNYCFLNARVKDILHNTDYSLEEILYSKYYWFTKYKDLLEIYVGEDPTLFDFQMQIFDQIIGTLKGEVDWPLMQAIDENKPWLSPTLVKELWLV